MGPRLWYSFPYCSHVLGDPSGGSIEGSSADPRKSHQAVGLGRPLGVMFPNGVGKSIGLINVRFPTSGGLLPSLKLTG